jgi:alginate biosynthesis protein AlgX
MIKNKFACLSILLSIICSICSAQEGPAINDKGKFDLCVEFYKVGLTDRVYQGIDGWFFRYVDFLEDFDFENSLENIVRISKAFSTQGIDLIVAPIPMRAMIYPDKLDLTDAFQNEYSVDSAKTAYNRMIAELESHGVMTVDLVAAALEFRKLNTDGTFFFKRDVHWTDLGAKVFSQAVAKKILVSPKYNELEKSEFNVTFDKVVKRRGSFDDFIKKLCNLNMPKEPFFVFRVEKEEQGLFDDSDIQVVLVGTSYSQGNWYQDFLSNDLSLNTMTYAVDGGGPDSAIQEYLLGDSYANDRPSFVVWEFPIHNSPKSLGLYRQIVPSIYGSCYGENILMQKDIVLDGQKFSFQNVPHDTTYVELKIEDKSIVNFLIETHFASGEVDEIQISRSTRGNNTGRFFFEPNSLGFTISELILNFATPVTSNAVILFCKYP